MAISGEFEHVATSPLLSGRGVGHAFGAVRVLQPTDLAVHHGEFLALLGPSGCGKTTLLKILSGLLEPSDGEVLCAATRRGFVFQRPVLLPWRSSLDNVLLPIQLHGRVLPEHLDRARQLLALVGLAGFEDHQPRQLSGGMQQRVALARAFIERPEVMFLDEPFSALDEITREEMNVELLRVFEHETELQGAVLVTHSVEEAVFLADRVAVLTGRPGQVVDVVDIDLPRPRTLDDKDTERFHTCVAQLRHLLRFGEPYPQS